jgi:RNA polymerase sigma-70 factor, ECF subfamily
MIARFLGTGWAGCPTTANLRRLNVSRNGERVESVDRSQEMMDESSDDARLVGMVLDGQEDAFGVLSRRYQRRVFGVCYRLLGNRDDALDVAQNVLLKAFRSLEQLSDAERFGPWLTRIARNLSLNYRRSRASSRVMSLDKHDGDGLGLADTLEGRSEQPSQAMGGSELRGHIGEAMEKLSAHQRQALILSSVEKMPQKDIAEMMGCTVEMVKWNVFQARKTLKGLLGPILQSEHGE